MNFELSNTIIQVTEANKVGFKKAHNMRLECLEGIIWITFDDLDGDFLLAAGEQLLIASNGLALISGLPSAKIGLTTPAIQPTHLSRFFGWINRHFLAFIVA
jgi:Protein of unknown function (DUF2917)